MAWFAAHIVMAVHLKGKRQNRFPVWENIVLIKANTPDEAIAKAERCGRANEGDDDGTFRWGGHPATWVFAGVRKVTVCVDPATRPADGSEITFNEYELGSQEAVEKYAKGEEVALLCRDAFGKEEEVASGRKKRA